MTPASTFNVKSEQTIYIAINTYKNSNRNDHDEGNNSNYNNNNVNIDTVVKKMAQTTRDHFKAHEIYVAIAWLSH